MATKSLQERLTALEETVADLQTLPSELGAFRHEVNSRFERIEARFDDRFDRVERRMSEENEQLYARMRMLHEELIDRIKIGRQSPDGREPDAPRRSRRRPKR